MSQYESSVKLIPYPQSRVYAKLEDLNNLEGLKDKLPQDKIKDLTYSRDEATVSVPPMGNVTIRVVEREEPKCIKLEATTSPLPLTIWVQMLPTAEEASKMKLTLRTELNPFIKGMVQKPLQEGIEKMAQMLAAIQY